MGGVATEGVDRVLEASVVGSFSRVGYGVRRRLGHWRDPGSMAGRVAVVTGASSGIGQAVAVGLARAGAEVCLVGRDPGRLEAAATQARAQGGGAATAAVLDVTDPAAVERWVAGVAARHERLDALVHCAGTLLRRYTVAADGTEATVATHVLAPYRLTWLLSPLLLAAGPDGGGAGPAARGAAVVTMTSGGMYAEPFDLPHLQAAPDGYDGVRAYARAKRAQVVLAAEWARRWGELGVASYSTHPGWAATPGLAHALPGFARALRPVLRTPAEGADTAVWLAAGGARPAVDGLWHDRHRRPEHRLARTRRAARPDDGEALWAWCAARTGLGVTG